MSNRALRCASCGALWISEPAQRLILGTQACLRCGGELLAGEEISEPARPHELPEETSPTRLTRTRRECDAS